MLMCSSQGFSMKRASSPNARSAQNSSVRGSSCGRPASWTQTRMRSRRAGETARFMRIRLLVSKSHHSISCPQAAAINFFACCCAASRIGCRAELNNESLCKRARSSAMVCRRRPFKFGRFSLRSFSLHSIIHNQKSFFSAAAGKPKKVPYFRTFLRKMLAFYVVT